MDNEAGMEHLSRGTTQNINELLIISNHSIKGVRTIARIKELIDELKLRVKHQSIVINMAPGGMDKSISTELDRLGLKPEIVIPEDETIVEFDLNRRSLLEMPDSASSVLAVNSLIETILIPART
jgi:CO dehydrogenase maturation factor